MIVVHHLNDSRSQRILWLLEELELPYQIKHYQRDANTRLAPAALKDIHPLGKSPVLTDDGQTVIESGAIIEYEAYQQWLHYSEGSAMLPLMLKLYVSRLGEAGAPLAPRIDSEISNHLGFVNASLEGCEWLVGSQLSGADIQMSFVGEAARGLRADYPNIDAWVKRFQARPAYRRALERGGPYALAS